MRRICVHTGGPLRVRINYVRTQPRASLALISAGLGAPGAAKLAWTSFTRDNFARWAYPDPVRFAIGAIEVGVAGVALAGLRAPEARPVAAIGTLCSMTGARATLIRAGDSAPNYVPSGLLAAAAVRVLSRDTFPQIKGRNEH